MRRRSGQKGDETAKPVESCKNRRVLSARTVESCKTRRVLQEPSSSATAGRRSGQKGDEFCLREPTVLAELDYMNRKCLDISYIL